MKTDNTFATIAAARGAVNEYLTKELRKQGLDTLAPTHGDIMAKLFVQESMTMKELAQSIRRDKSTITALVGKLEKQGFVERFRSIEDSRIVFVRLTPKGAALKDPFKFISERLFEIGLKDVSESEIEELKKILNKIIYNLSNMD